MPYNQIFFSGQKHAPKEGVVHVVDFLRQQFAPRSVVDIGCGVGQWLSVFRAAGVTDVLGVDGAWVPKDLLSIPRGSFLEMELSRPSPLGRKFDLVISLEVGEHIPAEKARDFVGFLASCGPVVCFSAAPPGQGGVDHVNEQPPKYWRELFAERGYRGFDCLRPRLWDEAALAYCYRQNLLMFVDESSTCAVAQAEALCCSGDLEFRHLTHPDNLASKLPSLDLRNRGVRPLLKALPAAFFRAFCRRFADARLGEGNAEGGEAK